MDFAMSSASLKLLRKNLGERRRLEGVAAFGAIWIGQVVSLFGSHLAGFVLGVWVYQETKSATDFSLIYFFSVLPEIALAPVAGVMVDRWDRRKVMLLGDVGAALCTAVMALLAITGRLQVWQIYPMVAMISAFQSVHFPALSSAITLLVPRRHLSRANGMVELGMSLAMVASPLVAGMLLDSIGLTRILVIDTATYAVAVITLLSVRIARPGQNAVEPGERRSLLSEAALGWSYVRQRPELIALLCVFVITNFTNGVVQVLLPPLVLSFTGADVLGMVMSAGGVGVVLGSILVSVWGGARKKVRAILCLTCVQGLILFLGVMQPQAVLVATAAFVFLFCDPIIFASSQTIWQTKVAIELQGRAFAMRRVVAWSSLPLAYISAGPLADRVFEPMMAADGRLAGTIGTIIGIGPGRGVALLFIVLGVLTLLAGVAGSRYRPLRELENRLPDVEASAALM
jgi:MFS family permease